MEKLCNAWTRSLTGIPAFSIARSRPRYTSTLSLSYFTPSRNRSMARCGGPPVKKNGVSHIPVKGWDGWVYLACALPFLKRWSGLAAGEIERAQQEVGAGVMRIDFDGPAQNREGVFPIREHIGQRHS